MQQHSLSFSQCIDLKQISRKMLHRLLNLTAEVQQQKSSNLSIVYCLYGLSVNCHIHFSFGDMNPWIYIYIMVKTGALELDYDVEVYKSSLLASS